MPKAVVIGAGFGGISAAAYLARAGYEVDVFEKNEWVGGRARALRKDGFSMDMGPSWYWMPGEHDKWFEDLGRKREEFYDVRRVDPSYKVYYGGSAPAGQNNVLEVPADINEAARVFESVEAGAGNALRSFIEQAKKKFDFAMGGFIYRNFNSLFDMVNRTLVSNLGSINLFKTYRSLIRRYFRHPYLIKILEFPVVFLGSYAAKTPAVYTLMNYIDFGLGTWYPDGGFARVVEAMQEVAEVHGARFHFAAPVTGIDVEKGWVRAVTVEGHGEVRADAVVANADYLHVEDELVPRRYRHVDERRRKKWVLAPAVLNFYVGFRRKIPSLAHHTFFFDTDWDDHFDAVYGSPRWPDDPLFYVHVPSITDPAAAPTGKEAVFFLIPCAADLPDDQPLRDKYFDLVLRRMESLTGEKLRDDIEFVESMSVSDFKQVYNAYRGTAFGLGQTLFQTAYFRPPNKSPKIENLYYAGHYTVPGTGTTMSMISGKLAAMRVSEQKH